MADTIQGINLILVERARSQTEENNNWTPTGSGNYNKHAQVMFGPVPVDHLWEINRVNLWYAGVGEPIAIISIGALATDKPGTNIPFDAVRDWSDQASRDSRQYLQSLVAKAGEHIAIRWTGIVLNASGDEASVVGQIEYDDYAVQTIVTPTFIAADESDTL